MKRRDFLAGVTAAVVAPRIDAAQAPAVPIIDTHIHLFDPNRPQGAPYSGPKSSGPPVAALPARYRALAAPLGAVGAIKVEASPWVEDNLWVLQVAQQDPMIVAVIGNLEPEKAEFAEYLGRYRKNPLFRGIRCGNLWGRDFTAQAGMPAFIDGLRRLAEADLVMDTANPSLALLQAVLRVTDQVPALRVVLDHLPALTPFDTAPDRVALEAVLRDLAARPQVYVKLSAIIHPVQGNGRDRPAALPQRARPADGALRRGSRAFRQRLAEQRRRRAGGQGVRRGQGVLRGQAEGNRREILLEELHRRVQVGQARPRATESLKTVSLLPKGVHRHANVLLVSVRRGRRRLGID